MFEIIEKVSSIFKTGDGRRAMVVVALEVVMSLMAFH